MNYAGVKQELSFLSNIIALLDDAITSVGEAADCMQSQTLQDSANNIENALEMLVTRELELERVSDVLNLDDDSLYQTVDLAKCKVNVYGDTVELIDDNSRIFLSADEIDLSGINFKNKNASEIEAP